MLIGTDGISTYARAGGLFLNDPDPIFRNQPNIGSPTLLLSLRTGYNS